MCKRLRATEILEIAGQQWATTKDIQMIGSIGLNKALEIKKEIRKKQLDRGDNLPTKNFVGMQEVLDYFKIDLNFLRNTIMEGAK